MASACSRYDAHDLMDLWFFDIVKMVRSAFFGLSVDLFMVLVEMYMSQLAG